jgi:hypothetical protein
MACPGHEPIVADGVDPDRPRPGGARELLAGRDRLLVAPGRGHERPRTPPEQVRPRRRDPARFGPRHRMSADESHRLPQVLRGLDERALERGGVGQDRFRSGLRKSDQEGRGLLRRDRGDDDAGARDGFRQRLRDVETAFARLPPDLGLAVPASSAQCLRQRSADQPQADDGDACHGELPSSPGTRTAQAGLSFRAPRTNACRTSL